RGDADQRRCHEPSTLLFVRHRWQDRFFYGTRCCARDFLRACESGDLLLVQSLLESSEALSVDCTAGGTGTTGTGGDDSEEVDSEEDDSGDTGLHLAAAEVTRRWSSSWCGGGPPSTPATPWGGRR
ncbi:unnamed protein product, partial [Lampetra fluviatilis]